MLLNNRYKKINDNEWIDQQNNFLFSHYQYRGQVSSGRHSKMFDYLDSSEAYITGRHGIDYFDSFFLRTNIEQEFEKAEKTEEIIYKSNFDISYLDKSVLIVGGGPTSNMVKYDFDYDHVFVCNNFFMNEKIKALKPDFLSLAPNVDFANLSLLEYLDNNQCFVGLEPEHIKPPEIKQVKKLYETYKDRTCVYQTRYCSTLGIGSRQVILAILLGAKKIYFSGFDLFGGNQAKTKHAFEKDKYTPAWRKALGRPFQDMQVIIFCDYIMKLKKTYDFEIYNLSEGYKDNCMSFVTKEMFPLSENLKELIR